MLEPIRELWLLIFIVLTPNEDVVFRLEGHDRINDCLAHRELLLRESELVTLEPERSGIVAYCVKNPEYDNTY